MNRIIETTLGSAVLDGGTVNISYPSGTNKGMFFGGVGNALSINGTGYKEPRGFTLAYNATNVTVTNNSGVTWASGSKVMLELQIPGERLVCDENGNEALRTIRAGLQMITLGAPITADADGISASQSVTIATTPLALLNGALASGGKVVLDVPRNVVAAWTGTAVLTVSGFDEYGQAMTESSASGTSLTGKKAFKIVTSASFSANVTAATIGTGDVLGLPIFMADSDFIIKELEDNAVPTAGTFVAGVNAKPTATTGDVRGTYDPNSACDGSKVFRLLVSSADPTYRGAVQYSA